MQDNWPFLETLFAQCVEEPEEVPSVILDSVALLFNATSPEPFVDMQLRGFIQRQFAFGVMVLPTPFVGREQSWQANIQPSYAHERTTLSGLGISSFEDSVLSDATRVINTLLAAANAPSGTNATMAEVTNFLSNVAGRLVSYSTNSSYSTTMPSTTMPPTSSASNGSSSGLRPLSDAGSLLALISAALLTPDDATRAVPNTTLANIDGLLDLYAPDALDPRWWTIQLLLDMLPTLPSSLAKTVATISAHAYGGPDATVQLTRGHLCMTRLTAHVPELVAHTWAVTYGTAEAGAGADRLTRIIKRALQDALEQNDWLTAATRQTALDKLQAMQNNIGFANKTEWLADYDTLDISSDASFVDNWLVLRRFHDSRHLMHLGKPLDPDRKVLDTPDMLWNTVNAFYMPSDNSINIFPVTLQPNWFDTEWLDVLNLAGLGMVLGHEMTHGFDKSGHMWNSVGLPEPWFTASDEAAFQERSQCFQRHFEEPWLKQTEPLFNVSNGLGEIVADSGGIKCAHAAVLASREAEEATLRAALGAVGDSVSYEQLFFYAYAHFWCGHATSFASKARSSDVHPSGDARVNGGLSNFLPFAKAFHCKAGDQMVQSDFGNVCFFLAIVR